MLKSICLGRVSYDINLVVDKMPIDGSKNEFFENPIAYNHPACTYESNKELRLILGLLPLQ